MRTMRWLLGHMARLVERRPGRTLLGLVVITIILAGFAADQSSDTELTAFAPDSELASAFDRIQDDFAGSGAQIQVIVDAGEGGDVLSPIGLAVADEIVDAVEASGAELAAGQRGISSFAAAIDAALEAAGTDPAQASDDEIDALAPDVLAGPAAGLFSRDLDAATGTARAALVIVELDPALGEQEAYDAALAVGERIDADVAVDGIEVDPFGQAILAEALQTESEEEMPRLLSLSLLLIIAILFFQYRSLSDVGLGFVGLIATIMWMFGLGVLLGPDYLGLVGPFTQISLIIPVLLIGLGIDYAIHLTSRYREEQRHGVRPPAAASTAVRTVGGALVLATLTTVIGFLTNLVSPLPPIQDFGVFTAVGVLSAFVVMTLMVPSARRLLDNRQRALAKASRRGPAAGSTAQVSGLARVMARTSVVAERAPRASLVVALVVTLVAGIGGATQIETSFSQDDFIPADSEPGRIIESVETLFGGDLTESTYVLVEGDLADPAVVAAVDGLSGRLTGIDDVRDQGGSADVTTPVSVLRALAAQDPSFADRAADLGFDPATGFAAGAGADDVVAVYDLAREVAPDRMAQVLAADDSAGVVQIATTAGQERAGALAEEVDAAVEPIRAADATTVVVSEPLVLEETLDALTASQTQGIVVTLIAALVLLIAYFGAAERRPLLGAITMVPSVAVVGWVLGTMVLLDISFNVLTAMVASLAIGIGVPFGIHVTHRFMEDRRRYDTVDEAVRQTVTHTGGAMAGSAATTAAGFGVLVFASLVPMQQFGIIVAITILYSLIAAVLIQPSCLKLWAEWRARRGEVATLHEHEERVLEPAG
ncbi:MAG: MMPL family transporter [Actinomycetota bacterium]|nr:MMPL family transporter [Actinomycetota bacterium]